MSRLAPDRAIHWILDWDGTLTKRDTLDALVNIAKDVKPESNIPGTWNRVTQAYLSDYEALLKIHAPDGKLPSTVPGERNLLKLLEDVEQKSIDRVSASEIFKGLTAKDIQSGAAKAIESGQVQLRDGCRDFLRHLRSRLTRQARETDIVDILSVNWSQRFIAGCLDAADSQLENQVATREQYKQEANQRCEAPFVKTIYANELEGINKGETSTGVLCAEGTHKIISSNDKLTYLEPLRKVNPHTMKSIPIVYVGDSWTDLECLLAADLGICIRDDPMNFSQKKLGDSLTRLGIKCPHLQDWESVDEWGTVWARDFCEITDWIQKSEPDTFKAGGEVE